MRKVLSFVLVLSLVLGSFGMAFAAPATDIAGKDCEEAVNVLTELGVVSGYTDGTYKPENVVTRAEMAALIVKSLGLNDYAVGTPKFTDSQNHWAKGYIAYANSLGIISGRTATTFAPDAIVTYDEAATMLVKALGYSDDTLVGAWPTNYVTKAKVLGILDDIQAGAKGANRGDCAIMLYQTLDQAIGKVNKDGDWVGTATAFNGDGTVASYDTMLGRLDAKLYDPDGTTATKKAGDEFVLTEADKVADGINVRGYYGANVTAYANSDNEIIAIKEVKSVFLTGEFGDTLGTFESGDVEYTLTADAKTNVGTAEEFVNGVTGSITTADGTTYTIAADASGKRIKDVYSVADWNADENRKFEADDAEDITEDNKLYGMSFAENDDEDIDLASFDLVGVNSLQDIKKDNVVYVYKNVDGISKVEVGTEVITGEVTKIKGDKFTINGKEYKFANDTDFDNTITNRPDVEDEIKAWLDVNGKIFDYEKVSGSADKLAVVLDVANGSKGLGGSDTKIKLFLADGTSKTFNVDYKDVAENDSTILTHGAVNITWTGIDKSDVIKYDINKDGEINAVEMAIDQGSASTDDTKLTDKGYFNKFKVNSDAVIFTCDTFGSDDADEYGVTTLEKMLDSTITKAWYSTDDDAIDAMLIDGSSASNADDVYGVVTDAEKNKSDAGFGVSMLVAGAGKDYDSEEDCRNYVEADYSKLYMLKFTVDGAVKQLVDADGENDTYVELSTTGGVSVSGKVVTIATKAGVVTSESGITLEATKAKVTLDASAVVYIWNDKDDTFEKGSIRDIQGSITSFVKFYDVFDEDGVMDIILVK